MLITEINASIREAMSLRAGFNLLFQVVNFHDLKTGIAGMSGRT